MVHCERTPTRYLAHAGELQSGFIALQLLSALPAEPRPAGRLEIARHQLFHMKHENGSKVRAYSVFTDHLTVVKIVRRGGRSKCHCGCGKRVTHYLAASGCNMGEGCEWSVWKRLRSHRPKRKPEPISFGPLQHPPSS